MLFSFFQPPWFFIWTQNTLCILKLSFIFFVWKNAHLSSFILPSASSTPQKNLGLMSFWLFIMLNRTTSITIWFQISKAWRQEIEQKKTITSKNDYTYFFLKTILIFLWTKNIIRKKKTKYQIHFSVRHVQPKLIQQESFLWWRRGETGYYTRRALPI